MDSQNNAMPISEKPIMKKGTMRTFKPSLNINRTLQPPKKALAGPLNRTERTNCAASRLNSVKKQLDREVGFDYSSVEYLCKNVKAKKGLGWILSLRNKFKQNKLFKLKEQPFEFWANEMQKWKDKFFNSNRSLEEDMNIIKRSYHYNFFVPPKTNNISASFSKFSTVDSLLLSGNTSQFSHCVENRKQGNPHKSEINFACLLRNYGII